MGTRGSKEKKEEKEEKEEVWADGTCKVVLVGDPLVGKRTLCLRESGALHSPRSPILEPLRIMDRDYGPLSIWKIPQGGDDERDRLRPATYFDANCILYCFSVVDYVSFESISTHWIPELQFFQPSSRGILVGTKSDLRSNKAMIQLFEKTNIRPVSKKEAEKWAENHNMQYIECCSLTGENVEDIFRVATDVSPIFLGRQKRVRQD